MAYVYILRSEQLDKFYVGTCKDLTKRMEEHAKDFYQGSYTTKASDWVLFLSIGELSSEQAYAFKLDGRTGSLGKNRPLPFC